MELNISVEEFVAGKLAVLKLRYSDASVNDLIHLFKEDIFVKYLDDMEEYFVENSSVDYPAGRDAGHSVTFDYELKVMRNWFNEYFEIRKELDKYLYREKVL